MTDFNNAAAPRMSLALLLIAPVALVLYVVPLLLWGLASDLFHYLTPWRCSLGSDLPWFVRLGALRAAQGRDLMIFDREKDTIPYLHRHYVTGRRLDGMFSVCLHHFMRSDDDYCHTHPWPYITIILGGGYWEHLPGSGRVWRAPGSILIRSAQSAHMVEMDPKRPPVWTLFIMGPRTCPHDWGFRTKRGFVHWQQYLRLRDVLGLRPNYPGEPGLPRPTRDSANKRATLDRIWFTRRAHHVPITVARRPATTNRTRP